MATEEIRELIGGGVFAPGERIKIDEVAQLLEVSRTPVRDALLALRNEGLVEIQPRVGAYVRQISRPEVEDVYALKAALEPMSAAWAAERGTDEDRQSLAAAVERLRAAAAEDDVRACAAQVEEIHTRIFEMAASEPVLQVYRVLRGRVLLLRYLNMAQPGRLEASVEQHTRIVEAVVAGDAESASTLMQHHMADAIQSLRQALALDDSTVAQAAYAQSG